MKQFYSWIVLSLLLMGWVEAARAQTFEWARLARSYGNPVNQASQSFESPATTDFSGSTYLSQPYDDSLRVGTVLLRRPATSGARLGAIIRYDSAGQVQWAYPWTNLLITQLAADNLNGGTFLIGWAISGATWRGTAWPVGSGAFYAKLSGTGTVLWCRALNSVATASLLLTADEQGFCYVAAKPQSRLLVGGATVDSTNACLFRVGPAGAVQWVRLLHGDGSPAARQVWGHTGIGNLKLGPKPGGGCLAIGKFYAQVYFGAGTASPSASGASNGFNAFLANYDSTGTLLWSRTQTARPVGNNIANTTFQAAAADAAGNCYVAGDSLDLAGTSSPLATGRFWLRKYNVQGAAQWVQTGDARVNSSGVCLAVARSGFSLAVGALNLSPDRASIRLSSGFELTNSPYSIIRFSDQGIAQWAANETWQGAIPTTSLPLLDTYLYINSLDYDQAGHIYCAGASQRNNRGQIPLPPTILLGSHTLPGFGGIVTRLNGTDNVLTGYVYLDLNGNGQFDGGDRGGFPRSLSARVVQGNTATYFPMQAYGDLNAYAGAGAYSLDLVGMGPHYRITQPATGQYTGSFASPSGNVQLNQVFGVAPIPNEPDLRVTLAPYTNARPGFLTRYQVRVENVGTTTLPAGPLTLTLDSRAQFVSSTPVGSRNGQVISWTYPTLAPFGVATYEVQFSLPITAPVGAVLGSTASAPVANDLVPADNTAGLDQPIVNSYDPNDIQVNYPTLTLPQVAVAQPLDYTVRFQNMGTAEALSVVIQDTLDFRQLNLNTMQLVMQSHNCIWQLSNRGLLTVRFLDINLPGRNTDVLRSQGFVRFRVQPRTTLAVGAIIPNRAHIFFDFNAPVGTNTATTTVLNPTAVLNSRTALAWVTYPNPATEALNIEAELPTAGLVQLQLLDVLGRPVQQRQLAAPAGAFRQTLGLGSLAPGLYVLRLTLPDGRSSTRTIERQ